MTVWELQKMSGEQMKSTLSKMTRSEMKEVVDSCGTSQGKSAMKNLWEKLTGKKY
jgi:hypothetical protein